MHYAEETNYIKASNKKIRFSGLLLSLFLLCFQSTVNANLLQDEFTLAMQAVEDRNYTEFERLISENPEIGSSSTREECPLLCELTNLLPEDASSYKMSRFDLQAFQIALNHGVKLSTYPHALISLILKLSPGVPIGYESPLGELQCDPIRTEVLSIVNQLLMVDDIDPFSIPLSPNSKKGSISFLYAFQMCQKAFICQDDNQKINSKISTGLRNGLILDEKERLLELSKVGLLDVVCISTILEK